MTNYSEIFPDCLTDFSPPKGTSNFNAKSIAIKAILKGLKIFLHNTLIKIFIRASNHKSVAILGILLFPAVSNLQAQQSISYALHANIIYRFTKYVEWPGYGNSGDFTIGIIGETELYYELKHFIENKTVGHRKIVVKRMSSSSDSYNCQILFISEEKSKSVKKIAEITKGTATLIVSESSGLASKGSCINFVIVNDHLKLEINKNNIEEHNLNIANELLSLGAIVK